MARMKFRYEQGKAGFDEIDHRGFTTGEERLSSQAHRRVSLDYGVYCATVLQCVYRHVDNITKTTQITHDQIFRETSISTETVGYCLDMLTIAGYLDCIRKGNSNNETGERHASVYKINPIDILTGCPTGRYIRHPNFDEERKKLQQQMIEKKAVQIDGNRVQRGYDIIRASGYSGAGVDAVKDITEQEISAAKQKYVDGLKETYCGKDKYKMVKDI